jgi:hypothetical protein
VGIIGCEITVVLRGHVGIEADVWRVQMKRSVSVHAARFAQTAGGVSIREMVRSSTPMTVLAPIGFDRPVWWRPRTLTPGQEGRAGSALVRGTAFPGCPLRWRRRGGRRAPPWSQPVPVTPWSRSRRTSRRRMRRIGTTPMGGPPVGDLYRQRYAAVRPGAGHRQPAQRAAAGCG